MEVRNNSGLTLESTAPLLRFKETDAPTDEQIWRVVLSGGVLSLRGYADDEASSGIAMSFDRAGTAVTAPTFPPLAGTGSRMMQVSSGGLVSAPSPVLSVQLVSAGIVGDVVTLPTIHENTTDIILTVDTENLDPSDVITNIAGTVATGVRLRVRTTNNARDVTIEDSANMLMAGDQPFVLTDTAMYADFVRHTSTTWKETSRVNNQTLSTLGLAGTTTFSGLQATAYSDPTWTIQETDAPVDEGKWRRRYLGGTYIEYAETDAGTQTEYFRMSRAAGVVNSMVWNESGSDTDFRWEAVGLANFVTLDAGLGAVRIGGASAGTTADFRSSIIVFNENGADQDFRAEGDTDVNLLFLDASTDRMGVGTATPAVKLDVVGEIRSSVVGTNAASVARVGGAQTLTDKTLTAPVINSPTGIVKGDVGLGNVDNTSDASKPLSTAATAALALKAPIGRGWLPSDLGADLLHWYRTDSHAVVANGTTVSTVIDEGPGADNATQTTEVDKPTYVTNAFGTKPSLNFVRATTQYLSIVDDWGDDHDETVFAVVKPAAFTGNSNIISSTTTGGRSFFIGSTGTLWLAESGADVVTGRSGLLTAGTAAIVGFSVLGDQVNVSINGLEDTVDTYAGTFVGGTTTQIGREQAGDHFDGLIAEVVVCRYLPAYQREKIIGYLAHKYGLTNLLSVGNAGFPEEHPWYPHPPGASTATPAPAIGVSRISIQDVPWDDGAVWMDIQGDNMNSEGTNWYPSRYDIRQGTLVDPVTKTGPLFKISRVEKFTQESIHDDVTQGAVADTEGTATFMIQTHQAEGSETQTIGLATYAIGYSAAVDTPGSGLPFYPDVIGFVTHGVTAGDATGTAAGAYIAATRGNDVSRGTACEMRITNLGTDRPYQPLGNPQASGVTLGVHGPTYMNGGVKTGIAGHGNAGVGFVIITNKESEIVDHAQCEVGFACTEESIRQAAFRDDSDSESVLDINQVHLYGIDMRDATFTGAALAFPDGTFQNTASAHVGEDGYYTQDDFGNGSNTSLTVGELQWHFGGGAATIVAPEAGHPGITRRDTSTTSGIYAYTRMINSATAGPLLPSETFDMIWVFRLNTNDANTTFRIGVSGIASDDPPATGIMLEKLTTDTNFFAVTRTASTSTRTSLGAADTSWHRLRIRRINSTTIGFTLDAGTEVTHTANIPTVAQNPFWGIGNTAAAAKTVDVDFFSLRISGITR